MSPGVLNPANIAAVMQTVSERLTAPDGSGAFTAMATPAVLLLVNAMLILSTIQRLQAILTRVRENEESLVTGHEGGPGGGRQAIRRELEMHGRRVRLAHRALFAFDGSAGVLLIMIGSLGAGALGWAAAARVALVAAFAGAVLLFTGALLLIGETWVGVQATDRRVQRVLDLCRGDSAARKESRY